MHIMSVGDLAAAIFKQSYGTYWLDRVPDVSFLFADSGVRTRALAPVFMSSKYRLHEQQLSLLKP